MIPITLRVIFKSNKENYKKEKKGLKVNTVRKVLQRDPRFGLLINMEKEIFRRQIQIFKGDTKESFIRNVTDVTYWDNRWIISWNSQEGNK